MKCRTIQNLLSDGEPSPAQQEAVTEHLRGCSDCRQFAAQLDLLADGLNGLPALPEPRPGFAGRTLARLPDNQPQTTWLDHLLGLLQPALATASLGLGILLAAGLHKTAHEPPQRDAEDSPFAEFFDITPFDSIDPDAAAAPLEGEN